ncbi:hypothetical protein Ddc_14455 [Ditylenchus destructor]|nr:hypothetical protein Ddc_14455 [Ditylenchus destructor]
MRGPEAHPATNLETLSDFLAEAMAVALYEYREGNQSPTQFPQAVRLAAEAKGPFQCSPVQTRDAQLSGLPTWAIAGIKPGLAGWKAEA